MYMSNIQVDPTCSLITLIRGDLQRYMLGRKDLNAFLYAYLRVAGFKYVFWLRVSVWSSNKGRRFWILNRFARMLLDHFKYKFGISIPYNTQIGPGFYIGHFGGIVVNSAAKIGSNCNISQGVTIGQANRGTRKGTPVIGDNVYIGPGAKIIGAVRVGNHCAIGANAVVTHDVPDNAVVAGIPAVIISYKGSDAYVEFGV
jgi:serine O-acetyltransferase